MSGQQFGYSDIERNPRAQDGVIFRFSIVLFIVVWDYFIQIWAG